jgi:hypothetical protein
MAWDGTERRRRKRYGLRNSTVRYRKGSGAAVLFSPASPTYLLLNFSEIGCHFISKEPLQPGRTLTLTIEAPKFRPATVTGRVVWAQKFAEMEAWRVGIEFTKVPEKSRAILKGMLDGAVLDTVEISTRVYMKEVERL